MVRSLIFYLTRPEIFIQKSKWYVIYIIFIKFIVRSVQTTSIRSIQNVS